MIGYSFATVNHVKSLRIYRLQLAIHPIEYNAIDAAMLTYMRTKTMINTIESVKIYRRST